MVFLEPEDQILASLERSTSLSADGCSILLCFMNHPGKKMSAERIFGRIWQPRMGVEAEMVVWEIFSLNEKLEYLGCPRMIQITEGYGYELLGEVRLASKYFKIEQEIKFFHFVAAMLLQGTAPASA